MPLLSDPMHEKFAQLAASGLSPREAYQTVFPNSKGNSASTGGWRLLKKEAVAARVHELQDKAAGDTVKTLAEKRQLLARIISDTKEPTVIRLRAIQIDNEMAGHNKPQEIHHSVEGGVEVLSEDFLAKLANASLFRGGSAPARPLNPAETNGDTP